ncbi:MAG: DUF3341 domain-containing protein [Phycisphaerae bacterium]
MHAPVEPSSPPAPPTVYGVLAQFSDVSGILHAAAQVRDAGYTRWDCHTPFPVHGLDKAMGIKPTRLPVLVFGAGMTGTIAAVFGQWFLNTPQITTDGGALDPYPMIFSGKPFWSLPANIPVAFEVTVLFAALTTFFGLWAFCKLPRWHHPVFSRNAFKAATDDTFFIAIEANDPHFDAQKTFALLQSAGAKTVEDVLDE